MSRGPMVQGAKDAVDVAYNAAPWGSMADGLSRGLGFVLTWVIIGAIVVVILRKVLPLIEGNKLGNVTLPFKLVEGLKRIENRTRDLDRR